MHLVDVDFEPKLRDRVSFELATFRDRPKAVEVTLESSRGPDDRSVRLQNEDAAWPKSERGRVADALLAWLQAKGGELALNSDAVTAFFAAHEALSKRVTAAKMAPSLALKRAVREFGTHLGMELKADATGRASVTWIDFAHVYAPTEGGKKDGIEAGVAALVALFGRVLARLEGPADAAGGEDEGPPFLGW